MNLSKKMEVGRVRGRQVLEPGTKTSLWPWFFRGLLVVLALAAPIITYRAFTDPDTPDPVKQHRLDEVNGSSRNSSGTVPRQPSPYDNRP
jgi:hypothetical protein